MELQSESITGAWKKALRCILERGDDFVDENSRVCREILNLAIEVSSPAADITGAVDILKRFNKWVYPSLDEIAEIVLSRRQSQAYSYSYGPRIFSFGGAINQVDDFVVPLLRKNPFSRRGIVVIWNPAVDANIYKRDVPGMVTIYFKLRNKRLTATMMVRSNDLFFGWPANIYQLFVLQDYVAKKIGRESGALTTFSTSAHIFKDQFEDIQKVLDVN